MMRARAFFTMLVAACSLQATAQAQDSLNTDSTLWYNRQSSESRTELAPVMPSRDGGRGKLNQTQQLGEVVIKSQKPKIRTNADGMNIIVTGSELEKVGSSKDLLKRLPTVKSAEDGVEIFGRGAAEVYVNGRKLYDMRELE